MTYAANATEAMPNPGKADLRVMGVSVQYLDRVTMPKDDCSLEHVSV